MFITDLILEVTRRCNMHCEHCLRGECQNVDITHEIIRKTLEPVTGIENIVFTGGEPSLNVDAMRYTLDLVREKGIVVDSFYIVTNGKEVSDDFLEIVREWDLYTKKSRCSQYPDYEMCDYMTLAHYQKQLANGNLFSEFNSGVVLSTDLFHEPISLSNFIKLSALACFIPEQKTVLGDKHLIDMGRAENICCTEKRKLDVAMESEIETWEDPNAREGYMIERIYVNALGDFQGCCDLSYEVQDQVKKGSVLNEDWPAKLIQDDSDKEGAMRTCA